MLASSDGTQSAEVSPNSDFLHNDHLLDTLVNLLKDPNTSLAAIYQKQSDAMARLLEALKRLELHIVTTHPTLSRDLARMRNVFVHRRLKAFLVNSGQRGVPILEQVDKCVEEMIIVQEVTVSEVSTNSDFLHDDHLLDTLVNLLKDPNTSLAAIYQKRSDAMARQLEALKRLELHIVTTHPTLSRDLTRMRNVFVHRRLKAFLGPHKQMPDVFVYMELVGSSIQRPQHEASKSLPLIEFYNMPPDLRDEITISSMLKQAPSTYATELGIHPWADIVFSPLIRDRVLPHGAMFHAPSSGKFIPDRKLVVSRDGQSIPVLFEFKKAWADLMKRLTNLVGFSNNPENSDEPEYSNLRQTVGYASAERSPCCVLSFGEETYYIDLVCFTDGGTGAFVQGPVLPSHACVVPEEPSLRAMAAGMAFRLLGILENEAPAHPPLGEVGFSMGGNSGAGGGADAPGSGSASQHGQEQPPASNAGPSGGESSRGAPSQSGAADGGASDSLPADTTAQPREAQVVKQDSGTDVTFGEGKLQKQKPKQYAVVITDRPDHELESVVHERLHDHPEWKDSFAAGFYLAIGRMIGASRHGTVRSALIRGVPAVAKFVMIEYMRAFVTERSNYTRVEELQGRSIAWLHDTCVYSVGSSVLIVERGEVLAPVRDIYNHFINPREALDKLTDDNRLRALEALNDIHSIGALHGDAHLGNVAITDAGGQTRAFWFDLEHMTFPTENLEEKQEKEKQQFIDEWKLTVYQLNASLK
ncbi:hypothetical protein HK105_207085 [Polyrhizophydium stewartii]|uniref:Protein kinase domain-containing protein n=1 Tax=Polyrhizophydium stewartii TaxID=2732419 RepID=A0ABR4N1U9_9FUNG